MIFPSPIHAGRLVFVSLIPGFALLILSQFTSISLAIILAFTFHLGITYLLRWQFAPAHQRGIRLVKRGNYAQALDAFQESELYFRRYPWIDQYRFLILLSAGKYSYLELAMNNTAFMLVRLGRREEAHAKYQTLLTEFPQNQMAQTALQMLQP